MSSPPPPPRPDLGGRSALAQAREPSAPWRAVEAIPVFIMALLLSLLGGLGAAAATPRCDLSHPTAACGPFFVLTTLALEGAFVTVVVLWVRFVSHAPLAALGAPRKPVRDLWEGVLGGVGLVVVGFIAGVIVVTAADLILGHPPKQPDQVPTYVGGSSFLLSSLLAILGAPLGEETFFRGFLYQGLRRRFSVWPAALLSAALFAAVHADPILIFALFPVGVGLALVYERRQSLLASMVAHATFNVVGIIWIVMER